MDSLIAELKGRDTSYCPLCGSKITMPLSAVDTCLIMEPMNGCCLSWAHLINMMDSEKSDIKSFPSETAMLVLEAILEGKRMVDIRSIIANSQYAHPDIDQGLVKMLRHPLSPSTLVHYMRILERERRRKLIEG